MRYPTKLTYYDDPYQAQLKTFVIDIETNDEAMTICFDETVFYPYGGGQPADQGTIETETGTAQVRNVRIIEGVVRHECTLLSGTINEDQDAILIIDWARRYRNMKVHSAGHLLHDVITKYIDGLTPIKGDHGSKPFLEYRTDGNTQLSSSKELFEREANSLIRSGRMVTCRETNLEELQLIARFIPANLPKNKPLRIMQIEGFAAMPDGGTQVRNISEIGSVEIVSILDTENAARVEYKVNT